MGDALAVALLDARGFKPEDFAMSHPGGALGRRLLLKVADVMHHGDRLPVVTADVPLRDALMVMTQKGLGMVVVQDRDETVTGLFTDGDLRRVLDLDRDLRTMTIREVMTPGGKSIDANALAAEAVAKMEQHKVMALLVLDARQHLAGIVHMHELLRAGVV